MVLGRASARTMSFHGIAIADRTRRTAAGPTGVGVNRERTVLSGISDSTIAGASGEVLPALVREAFGQRV